MPDPANSDNHKRVSTRLVPIIDPAGSTSVSRVKILEEENEKLRLLLETAQELAEERSLDLLMDKIVERTSKVMNCDRSSVFLLDSNSNELYSLIAQGLDSKKIRFSVFSGLAGYAARMRETVNIPDAYKDERFNQEFDQQTGFCTKSVLCMPLFNRRNDVMGAIQCLNKKNNDGRDMEFTAVDERMLGAFAAQASVFLENASLQNDMDQLFEAVVATISQAIDARDICTSGHSRRVTLYTLNLARAVHESEDESFAEINYTRDRMRRLRYAGLLHDVGKIGVREYILCKANKLLPSELTALQNRFEMMRERMRADKLDEAWETREVRSAQVVWETECGELAGELEEALSLIESVNIPGFLEDEKAEQLKKLLLKDWITKHEYENLSVKKGNLTSEEWVDMKSHAAKSRTILDKIPWPKELTELPRIAAGHHEKLDGTGYPEGLRKDKIHFDSQVMCVADIYDGLTASDRPYKKAIPHDRAKQILGFEAKDGKIMPELVDLFFKAYCFRIPKDG